MADIFNSSTVIVFSLVSQIAVKYPAFQFSEEDGLNTAHYNFRCVKYIVFVVFYFLFFCFEGTFVR